MTPSESSGSGGTTLTFSKRSCAASSGDEQAAGATDSLRDSREHDQVAWRRTRSIPRTPRNARPKLFF
jgi:hypothetical protein